MRKQLNELVRKVGNCVRKGLGDTLASEIKVVRIGSDRYFALVDDNSYTTVLEGGIILSGRYRGLEGQVF